MKSKLIKSLSILLLGSMIFTGCSASKTNTSNADEPVANNEVKKHEELAITDDSKYPERSIQMVIPFGSGGGTDAWGRVLADEMSKTLGQPIIASNMTGGSAGSIGVDFVWKQKHDGYTICATSETPLLIPVQTGIEQTSKDWEYFLAGGSPAVLCVNKNSEYKTLDDVIKAVKETPKSVSIAGTQGGLWFCIAQALISYGNLDLNWIPYDGSGPAIKGAVSNEADLVVASAGEVIDFVRAGDLIPLAHMDTESWDFPEVGELPAITETLPDMEKAFPLKQIIGMMVPKDTPSDVLEKITDAFNKAMESDKIKEFAEQQCAVIYNETSDTARETMSGMEKNMSWLLYDMKQTKFSPEEFKIERPE